MRLLRHDSSTSVQYVDERKITQTQYRTQTVQTISPQSYTQYLTSQ